MPPKRMTANPSAPMRYRVGEAPAQADLSASDSDSESDSEAEERKQPPPPQRGPGTTAPSLQKIGGDFAARQAAATASRAAEEAARRREVEEGFETASSDAASGSDDDDDDGAEDDDDSESESESDYSSDSSGAQRRARFVVPTYVSKAKRSSAAATAPTDDAPKADQRQAKADAQLQAALDREAADRAASRRDWDAEDLDPAADVDDTDGLDPAAEHAAWRLRELQRVRRERSQLEEAEREREEVERRRNLNPEERAREDAEFLASQKEGMEGRGKMGFMQRYHHKGAFFQAEDGATGEDDEAVRKAMTRDVNGVTFMDDARDREGLPQYMQIRDMTKLGKKGRTRYKDLRSEDTGSFGFGLPGSGGRRDRDGGERPYRDREGPSGANNTAVGERRRLDDEGGNRDEKRPRIDR